MHENCYPYSQQPEITFLTLACFIVYHDVALWFPWFIAGGDRGLAWFGVFTSEAVSSAQGVLQPLPLSLLMLKEPIMPSNIEKAVDSRARRAAQRVGLRAIKSRVKRVHYCNEGGYLLVDSQRGFVQYGRRYELSATDVLDICQSL